MQEVFQLAEDKWAWLNYQIEVSEDAEHYACKILSAAATAIFLDLKNRAQFRDNLSSEEAMKEYEERVIYLFNAFRKEFGHCDCQSLLGFDPMKYDEYPEDKQEYIAKGDWMKECCVYYIEFIVKALYNNR
jgi:hypothetical protein